MSHIYVLVSAKLSGWAQRNGLGTEVVKVGYTNDALRIRLLELKAGEYGGVRDWRWPDGSALHTDDGKEVEAEVHRILRERGLWLDPRDHPQLKDEFGKPSQELFATSLNDALSVVRTVEKQLKGRRKNTGSLELKKVRRKRTFRSMLRRFIISLILIALTAIALGKLLEDDPASNAGGTKSSEERVAPGKSTSQPTECFVADKDLEDGRTVQHRICKDADGIWQDKGEL